MFECVASNLNIRDCCSSLDSPGNQPYGFGQDTHTPSSCFLIHKDGEVNLFILTGLDTLLGTLKRQKEIREYLF